MINVTQTFLPPIEEYVALLQDVWESKWLTNRGKLVQRLETKLKQYLGVKHLLAVNNGTFALQVAIKALDLKGEIITTPFSYVATVSSIVWENCTPVFVDIDADFLTIDETKIEAAITEKTSAILATHVYGNPCNVEAIEDIARRHNLKVIYDAAHCFGVKYKGESLLNWGDVSTLSFHATKLFHTGEGGGVVCNDDELADKIFNLHNFGHNGPEDFYGLGVNGKISELQAAMGLAVFPYIDKIICKRRQLVAQYNDFLAATPIRQINIREGTEWNYSYYPVIFDTEEKLLSAQLTLNKENIFPRRYFYPSLNTLPYVANHNCPVAFSVSHNILCLPIFHNLSIDDVEIIVKRVTDNI